VNRQPLHIGIDARLPFQRGGGISEYVTQLIAAIADLETTDRFTIVHDRRDPQLRMPAEAVNMFRADVQTPSHHPYERLLLARELAPHRLDVLHSPDFIPPSAGALRRVISVHDLAFVEHPDLLDAEARRYYGQLEWAVTSADAIACISDTTRDDLLRRFDVDGLKATTTPLAASGRFHAEHSHEAVAATLNRYGLEPGYLLFVGTLEPRKNVTTLVRACERMTARGPNAPLVLVGEPGWQCDEIRTALERTTADVRRLGRVPAADLPHLYAGAALLAMPSTWEGFGLPVIEAMQSGCAVVASTGGALPETAGAAALLVDPLDVDGWARALTSVLTDGDLRRDLRLRGMRRARAFSWRRTAEATLALYHASDR
jgi:glycosyltransferase involved in cell wall biosynthesis